MLGIVIADSIEIFLLQLVSESVKTRQAHSFLLSERQSLDKQLQQVNVAVESLRGRIFQCEEQASFSYFKKP